MNEDQFYEFGIGGFALIIALVFIPAARVFLVPAITLLAIIGLFFFFKGFVELIIGRGTKHFWMGIGLCLMIAVMFNGTGLLLTLINMAAKLASGLINAVF